MLLVTGKKKNRVTQHVFYKNTSLRNRWFFLGKANDPVEFIRNFNETFHTVSVHWSLIRIKCWSLNKRCKRKSFSKSLLPKSKSSLSVFMHTVYLHSPLNLTIRSFILIWTNLKRINLGHFPSSALAVSCSLCSQLSKSRGKQRLGNLACKCIIRYSSEFSDRRRSKSTLAPHLPFLLCSRIITYILTESTKLPLWPLLSFRSCQNN